MISYEGYYDYPTEYQALYQNDNQYTWYVC